MNWLWKLLAAILVWVVVAVVLGLLGSLIATVDQAQIKTLGEFLKDNAGLLGFLAGAAWFVWGSLPGRTV
jgi:type III secretory pathway component EscS